MKILEKRVIINSRKFDNKIHKSWKAELVERRGRLLVFRGVFETEIKHSLLGIIRRGTVSLEYYWLDRWFNIFHFIEPEGNFRNFYCNINMPPVFKDGVLDYIDLDIDLLVGKDLSYQILDQDEFAENSRLFFYSDKLKADVKDALKNLIAIIEKKQFPFDKY